MLIKEKNDSGIEWIGEMPLGWTKVRYKFVFKTIKGKIPKSFGNLSEGMYPYISMAVQRGTKTSLAYATKEEGVLVDTNTICVLWDGANAGEFFKSRLQGLLSSTVAAIIPLSDGPKIEYEFLYYYLKAYENELKSKFVGMGIPHVDSRKIKNDYIIHPNIETQIKIIKILNEKNKHITKAVINTKKSIKELKEYKQSVIIEAVTKGLNPNAELKDSGVEWIGTTPTTWKTIKINQLFSIKKDIANETGYDVLSVTQRGLRVRDIEKNEGQMAADYSKYQIVEPNDFVMNHMDLLTGWVDKAKQQGVTSPDYRVFKNKQKDLVFNNYFLYIFQSCYSNKIFYGLGQGVSNVGRWRLQTDKFLNFYLPLPSITEQKEIVAYLDGKIKVIDTLINDKEKVIEELERYKKSLIYEYVTGKKEV